MSRILVTGAAGMLGAHLTARLVAEGHQVNGVDLRPGAVPEARHSIADVRDPAAIRRACRGVDAVVHCAAALPSYAADQIRSVIVDGTTTVLTAARDSGVERFVHISSTAVYGLPKIVPTTEHHPREPTDTYSRAKVAAEQVCERFRADGMCLPILRPKTFLGPGRLGLFSMLFEWADEGRHFPVLGKGDVRIQMFDMDDLLEGVLAALRAEPEVANDTFNLAATEFGTLREQFQAVLDAAGHHRRVKSIPTAPALAILTVLERTRLSPVYGRLLHKLRADSFVSIDHARDRLGFTPKYSTTDSILRTYDWWREHRPTVSASASGRTSRDPWRQGALALAKVFF